jgi:hypothetical protein
MTELRSGPGFRPAAMPRYRHFDAQVRFVLSARLKNRLSRDAARRRMSAADLLWIEEGLAGRYNAAACSAGQVASAEGAAVLMPDDNAMTWAGPGRPRPVAPIDLSIRVDGLSLALPCAGLRTTAGDLETGFSYGQSNALVSKDLEPYPLSET